MTSGPPERIIVGGVVWPVTAALAEALATGAPGRRPPGVVVWDERDEAGRWADRPGAFVVRERWLRTWPDEHGLGSTGRRLADLELRADLWRHRRGDLALVGHVALRAAPWLSSHRGMRVWLPTIEDLASLGAGLTIPPVEHGGPHVIVADDIEVARHPVLAAEPRHRWVPGLLVDPRPAGRPAEIIAVGRPDRANGVDLVCRILARAAPALRERGARVRWLAPPGEPTPPDAADLELAGVDDLVAIEHVDLGPAFRRAVADPATAAVLVCGRPAGYRPADQDLVRAYREGIPVIGFGDGPPPDLAVGAGWTVLAFGDVIAAADAVAASTDPAAGHPVPGPVGLSGLMAAVRDRG